MARRKPSGEKKSQQFFNVVYEDGTLSSNRKVPATEFNMFDDDDDVARAYIEAQDRDIALKSGRPRGRIKTIARAGRR